MTTQPELRSERAACGVLLRSKPGDRRVFCSYCSTPCPPARLQGRACGAARASD